MHERYWHGTIEKVNSTYIELLNNLLPRIDTFKSEGKEGDLNEILDPLSGKIHIEASIDKKKIYSNLPNPNWKVKERISKITLPDGIEFIISNYEPPTWNYQYVNWIKNPSKWLTPSGDFITIPFIFFALIYLLFFYTFAWRMKATYLAEDVMDIIKAGNLTGNEEK